MKLELTEVQAHYNWLDFVYEPDPGIFLWNLQGRGGGAFEILDLFWQIMELLTIWTFQYAAGFRGPGILIKRSTIVDFLYAAWLRGFLSFEFEWGILHLVGM